MDHSRANILTENELSLDSVVKDFFITPEEISVVHKERRQMEKVSVCKEFLLTASTIAKFATVQKKKSDGVGHIQTADKMIFKTVY